MAILEITLLCLKPNIRLTDPVLLSNLQSIRSQLGTDSRFFIHPGMQNPGTILILGAWPDLQAHIDFLESEDRDKILAPQAEQTSFVWSVHVDMGLEKGMSSLPLDLRRAISVTRLSAPILHGGLVEAGGQQYLKQVGSDTKGEFTTILRGWRVDPDEATKELVLIIGRDDLIGITTSGDSGVNSTWIHKPGQISVTEVSGYDLENEQIKW